MVLGKTALDRVLVLFVSNLVSYINTKSMHFAFYCSRSLASINLLDTHTLSMS